MGTYQTAVSVEVPPYHGLEPRLSIVYNSAGGDGFVGVGWALAGLSAIQRASAGKGVPTYDSYDFSRSTRDIALLDGMQLRKCYPWLTNPSCSNPSSVSKNYVYYATKIENFQRIAYDPSTPMGVWHIWRKDGTMLTYGGHFQTTRLTSSGTYRWLLESVVDTLGNTVSYNYDCDTTTSASGDECYISNISYNFDAAIGMREKVMFYRELRPDVVTYAMGAGSTGTMRYRLKTIDVDVVDSGGSHRARAYKLVYSISGSTGRSILSTVQQFGTDATLDDFGTVTRGSALPPTLLTAQDNSNVGKWTGESQNPPLQPGVNTPPAVPMQIFDETQWTGIVNGYSGNAFWDQYSAIFHGDANGDGRIDTMLAQVADPTSDVPYQHLRLLTLFNNPDGTLTHTQQDTRQLLTEDTWTLWWKFNVTKGYGGDVNGDGKTDFILLTRHEADTSNGPNYDHFSVITAISNGDGSYQTHEKEAPWGWDPNARFFLADVNGDGKTDIVGVLCAPITDVKPNPGPTDPDYQCNVANANVILAIAISKGDGDWILGSQDTGVSSSYADYYLPGDANGDGRTDVMLARYFETDKSANPNSYHHFGFSSFFSTGNQSALHGWEDGGWNGWQAFDTSNQRGTSLAVGQNKDGRLEVFLIGTDQGIYHNWQVSPNGGWSGWNRLGSTSDKGVSLAVGQNSDGRLEVFLVGTAQNIWHNWQQFNSDGSVTWSGWQALGDPGHNGVKGTSLAVGQNKDGRLEVFMIGTDQGIYHNWQAPNGIGGWSGWNRLGSTSDKGVSLAVGQNSDGRLEVFLVGTALNIWHDWQQFNSDGSVTWSGWQALGDAGQKGVKGTSLAVGRGKNGSLEVFLTGTDQAIYYNWQSPNGNAGWNGWTRLGTPSDKAQSLAVGRNNDGRLELFAIRGGYSGTAYGYLNNEIAHYWEMTPDGTWSGGERIGNYDDRGVNIAVALRADGRLEAVLVGTAQNLYYDIQDVPGGSWSGSLPPNALFYQVADPTSDFAYGDSTSIESVFSTDPNGDSLTDFSFVLSHKYCDTAAQTASGCKIGSTQYHNAFTTLLSKGTGQYSHVDFDPATPGDSYFGVYWVPGDLNGDGRTDFFRVGHWLGDKLYAVLHPFISAGDGTYLPGPALNTKIADFEGRPVIVDYDGDGYGDFVHDAWNTDQCWNAVFYAQCSYHFQLRVQLTTGYGNSLASWKAGDFNGDGRTDWVHLRYMNPGVELTTLFRAQDGSWKAGGSPQQFVPSSTLPGLNDPSLLPRAIPMDVNGDGRTDQVMIRDYIGTNNLRQIGIYTFLAQGDGTWKASYFDASSLPGLGGYSVISEQSSPVRWIPMDVQGNGIADLVQVRAVLQGEPCANPGTHCYPGLRVTTLMPSPNRTWDARLSDVTFLNDTRSDEDLAWKPMDVNGDGRVDLVRPIYDYGTSTLQVQTLVSNGDGTWIAAMGDPGMGTGESDTLHWIPADVNGDGATDLVRVVWNGFGTGNNGPTLDFLTHTLVSTGDGHWTQKTAGMSLDSGDYFVPAGVHLTANVNNDRRTDLVHLSWSPTSGMRVRSWLSNGNGDSWTPTTDPNAFGLNFPFPSGLANWRVTDLDGDGQSDLVNAGSNVSSGMPQIVGTLGAEAHDVIAQVTSPLGGFVGVSYLPSSYQAELNDPKAQCGLPVGAVLQVVSGITTNDSRGNLSSQSYHYQCPVWDYAERGPLGWSHVTISQAASVAVPGMQTDTYYQLSDYCGAQPSLSVISDSQSNPYIKSATTYYNNCLPATHRDFQCNGTATCLEVDSDFAYDAFGNPTFLNEYGATGTTTDQRSSGRTYSYNGGAYVVALPASDTVYQGIGSIGTIKKRQTMYCYDLGGGSPATGCAAPPSKGLLISSWAWNDQTGKYITETFGYDGYGNRTALADAKYRTTNVTYDIGQQNQFPVQTCNALNQCSTEQWDYRFGKIQEVIDPNHNAIQTAYDTFGREISVKGADGSSLTRSYVNWGNPNVQHVHSVVDDGTPDGLWTDTYVDGLGRTYRVVTKGDATGVTFVQDTNYDGASNRAYRRCRPYRYGSGLSPAPICESFQYDAIARLTSQKHADGSSLSWSYGNDQIDTWTTFRDEQGHERTYYKDAYGRVAKVGEQNAGQYSYVTYIYDVLNRLTRVTDAAGNVSSISWDSLGRKIRSSDPDMGQWTYQYDDVGNLLSQTDARKITTVWSYDALNRRLSENVSPQNGSVIVWNYDEPGHGDAIGKLTSTLDSTSGTCPLNMADIFNYDVKNRTTEHTKCVLGSSYDFTFTNDKAGRLASITYPPDNPAASPTKEVVKYTYDPAGRLYSVSGYVNAMLYDAAGNRTTLQFSNGVVQQFSYDPNRNWLLGSLVRDVESTTQYYGVSYKYLPDGLISSQMQFYNSPSSAVTRTYGYDDLHRLVQAGGDISQQWGYDVTGNITSNSAVGTYQYPAAGPNGCGTNTACPHPHAVTQAGTATFSYDANGNTVSRNGKTATWDYRNLVQSLQDPNDTYATTFWYDASGERAYKVTSDGGYHYYFGPFFEQEGIPGKTSVSTWKYYYAGRLLIARKDSNGNKLWYYRDLLGSTRELADSAHNVTQQYDYKPFGSSANSPTNPATDIRYTGQRADDTTGLIYLNARYYDALLGRFLSADSIVPNPMIPQNFNRYSYASNNPISFVDPTGHQEEDPTEWVTAPESGAVQPPPLVTVEGDIWPGEAMPMVTVPYVPTPPIVNAEGYVWSYEYGAWCCETFNVTRTKPHELTYGEAISRGLISTGNTTEDPVAAGVANAFARGYSQSLRTLEPALQLYGLVPSGAAPRPTPTIITEESSEAIVIPESGSAPSVPQGQSTVPLPNPGENPMAYGTRVHQELPRIVGETNPGAEGTFNVAPGLTGEDLANPTGMNATYAEMKSLWGEQAPMIRQASKWGFDAQTGRYFFYDRRTGLVFEGIIQTEKFPSGAFRP